jgi:hypothetical protein
MRPSLRRRNLGNKDVKDDKDGKDFKDTRDVDESSKFLSLLGFSTRFECWIH